MAKTFYAVLTNYGAQQFAQAVANKRTVNVTHFAVGDGNGKAITPSKTRTALFREVHRNTVSNIAINASNNKQVEFELTLPENVGGFTIRETGIFDANNKMLAHANTPESYKPTLAEGSGKIQVLRMIVTIESSDAVTLTVDNSAIWATRGQVTPKKLTANTTNSVYNDGHTHEIAKASTSVLGIVQLSSATNSTAENLAATPKAVKDAYDRASVAVSNAATAQSTANGKWTAVDATTGRKGIVQLSSATDSTAENLAATPKAVKDAYDRASVAVSNANTAQTAANTAQNTANGKWTAVDATTARKGIVQLSSATNSTAENLAATPKAVKDAYDRASLAVSNAATAQTTANTAKTTADTLEKTKAPIKNPEFTGTLKTDYRLSIEREHTEYAPYLQTIDLNSDFASGVPNIVKTIGEFIFKIKNGESTQNLGLIRTEYNLDKSGVFRAAAYSSQGNTNWLFAGFGETGNVAFGKRSDDGTNRVQIDGTATVSAPATNANNAQVPTTAWVHQQNYFKSTGGTLTGNLAINSGNDYSTLSQRNTANKHARAETLPDSNTNFYKISYWNESNAETDAAFFPKSGRQKIVAYQDWTNEEINKVKTIATTAQTTANGKWTAVGATTGRKGIVQLSSATNSTAENLAATPKAVKEAYSLASVAVSNAATAQTTANNAQTAANNAQSTANGKSTVAILTGEIRHGGTIPLPSGFTQAQCKWFVAIRNSNPDGGTWDINENGLRNHFRLDCYADANRKVTARQFREDSGRNNYHEMIANYLIIGVK